MSTNLINENYFFNKLGNFLEIKCSSKSFMINLFSNPIYTVYNDIISIYTNERSYMLDYKNSEAPYNYDNIDDFLIKLRSLLTPIKQHDYFDDLAHHDIPTSESIIQFGEATIGVTRSDIWPLSEEWEIVIGVTGEQLKICSNDVEDTFSTGSGGHTITLFGLDENFDNIIETLLLNGINPIYSTNLYSHLNRAYITSSGDYHINKGEIHIHNTENVTKGYIKCDDGVTQQ